MERDQIIILSLRQLSCAPPEGIESLENLDSRSFIGIVAHALFLITDGETQFDVHLPTGMASRHRLCTDMAHAVKRLGYDGECGYNQLLYPSHLTTRSILGFLVEKLPREEDAVQEEMLGVNALLNRRIIGSIETWTKVCAKKKLQTNFACYNMLSCTYFTDGSTAFVAYFTDGSTAFVAGSVRASLLPSGLPRRYSKQRGTLSCTKIHKQLIRVHFEAT